MKKEMAKVMAKVFEHIETLGNASYIYGWGGCIFAIFEEDETSYCFRIDGNKYYVSHCGFGKGCTFTEEEEFEIK